MAEIDRELKNTLQQIEKQFGKGSIMQLGEGNAHDVQGISTGSLSLDIALGGRGLPRGRIVEIYGPEASGKTTVALHTIANAQRAGGVAGPSIDAEHAARPGWANKRIGQLDLEGLLVSQPSNGEEALKIAEMLVKSNAVDIIVIDSVAALVPRAEVEGEIGDQHMGMQARLMSQALRMLNPTISKTKTCMVFINQIRQKIGVMFGNPETTSGGLALKFYCSVRLEIRKVTAVKDGDDVVGTSVRVKVVKNKVAQPRSARPSSTSCTTAASTAKAISSISLWKTSSSRKAVPGSTTANCASARDRKMPKNICATIPPSRKN